MKSIFIKFIKHSAIKLDEIFFSDHISKSPILYVLTFHSVHKDKDEKYVSDYLDPKSSISLSKLEKIIYYLLENNIQIVNSNNLINNKISNINVMLSFDDGYYNNHLLLELSNKYDIPFEVFICSKNIESGCLFWWDIIYQNCKNPDNFKKLHHNEILKISNDLSKNTKYCDINRPFKISELKNFSQNKKILIGNHTHSHSINNLVNHKYFFDDVKICQDKIFEWTGIKPISFAFPNGNYLQNSINLLNKIGLKYNYVVYPDYIKCLKISKNDFLPRFMFSTDVNMVKYLNAIFKGPITLNTLKSIKYFQSS